MARYAKQKTPQAVRNPFEPMLKTVEQMAVVPASEKIDCAS